MLKKIAGMVAGFCVGSTITAALDALIQPKGKFDKLTVGLGGMILSSMVADKASEYVGDTIDETMKEIKELSASWATSEEEEGKEVN